MSKGRKKQKKSFTQKENSKKYIPKVRSWHSLKFSFLFSLFLRLLSSNRKRTNLLTSTETKSQFRTELFSIKTEIRKREVERERERERETRRRKEERHKSDVRSKQQRLRVPLRRHIQNEIRFLSLSCLADNFLQINP